jgi:hypothetical protein
VSGRPISFISLLDTPRYGSREIAELPQDRAAGPVVYAGSVDTVPAAGVAGGVLGGVPETINSIVAGSGGVMGGGTYLGKSVKQFVANRTMAPKDAILSEYAQLQASSVEGATGTATGELFEYGFAGPVTIKKSQSAMLPFLQNKVSARKLLIYTQNDGEHPVNAAEITNNTAQTLEGGPITVFDCGSYAGEALFETVKAGDKRLIGYAVDYGTRVIASIV